MYNIESGYPILVQQVVSGTGVFNETEYGRAKAQYPASPGDPNAVVRVSAKLYGTAPNAYTVAFVDAGSGVTVSATTVSQSGPAISVRLRRNSGAILATANEVATALNNANLGICAVANGTGNGVVAPQAATAITNQKSGADPALFGPNQLQYHWYIPVNSDGGLFYFEQQRTVIVRQFEANFTISSGTYTVTIKRANLNSALEVISTESVPVFVYDALTSSQPDIAVLDFDVLLHPQQALLVSTSGGGLSGLVRFDVRKAASYPYL